MSFGVRAERSGDATLVLNVEQRVIQSGVAAALCRRTPKDTPAALVTKRRSSYLKGQPHIREFRTFGDFARKATVAFDARGTPKQSTAHSKIFGEGRLAGRSAGPEAIVDTKVSEAARENGELSGR